MIENNRYDKEGKQIPLSKDEKLSNAKELLEKGKIRKDQFDVIEKNCK